MTESSEGGPDTLLRCARSLRQAGLNQGTEGNLSLRTPDGLLITPSGILWDQMRSDHMVPVGSGRAPVDARPSSEWPMHRAIYDARPDINAIVHTHSSFATTLACLRRGLPAFHYMIAVAGGADIRCSSYATFGTAALATAAVEALEGRFACLLANHGLVAAGADLDRAVALALTVERLCEQYWRACLLGEPVLLSDTEMAEALQRFVGYGMDTRPPRR